MAWFLMDLYKWFQINYNMDMKKSTIITIKDPLYIFFNEEEEDIEQLCEIGGRGRCWYDHRWR